MRYVGKSVSRFLGENYILWLAKAHLREIGTWVLRWARARAGDGRGAGGDGVFGGPLWSPTYYAH